MGFSVNLDSSHLFAAVLGSGIVIGMVSEQGIPETLTDTRPRSTCWGNNPYRIKRSGDGWFADPVRAPSWLGLVLVIAGMFAAIEVGSRYFEVPWKFEAALWGMGVLFSGAFVIARFWLKRLEREGPPIVMNTREGVIRIRGRVVPLEDVVALVHAEFSLTRSLCYEFQLVIRTDAGRETVLLFASAGFDWFFYRRVVKEFRRTLRIPIFKVSLKASEHGPSSGRAEKTYTIRKWKEVV